MYQHQIYIGTNVTPAFLFYIKCPEALPLSEPTDSESTFQPDLQEIPILFKVGEAVGQKIFTSISFTPNPPSFFVFSTSPFCLCTLTIVDLSVNNNSDLCHHQDFPGGSDGKASACNARDLGSISGLGRSPGEGNGNPLQYSCLENPMKGGAWQTTVHGVAKSQTRLRDFTFTFHFHALEKEMATHSSVLAWRIPGMGKPVGLPSIGWHRVGHN